jgi:hypothetical protein
MSECEGINRQEALEEVAAWIVAIDRKPELLTPVSWSLFSREQLYESFHAFAPCTTMSRDAFGRALRQFGRGPVNLGFPVKTKDGSKRLFAMRNVEYLRRAVRQHITRTYDEERRSEQKTTKLPQESIGIH